MSEIVWESDAQSSGFTIMSNGMVWPDDWPGTLVEAQFTSARGDGADLDRDPDMVPSGPGRVTFTPLVRTVGYDGEHGKRIVSLHPFEAVVGDDGFLYTPDEYGQPGIRGIVLPSNNSDVVDEHDWTWRVTFDIPNTTIRPTHIPTPHDHSVDIKDYLDSDANYGVRVVVDRVAARETLTARDEVIQARDLVLPARDETLVARDETLALGLTVDTSVGTRVYVGDTMIYGDTGWRHLGSSNTDAAISADIHIRRQNAVVELFLENLMWDGAEPGDHLLLPGLSLRRGFSQKSNDSRPLMAVSDVDVNFFDNIIPYITANRLYMRWVSRMGRNSFHSGEITSTKPLAGSITWTTTDSWPATLPGTPS